MHMKKLVSNLASTFNNPYVPNTGSVPDLSIPLQTLEHICVARGVMQMARHDPGGNLDEIHLR